MQNIFVVTSNMLNICYKTQTLKKGVLQIGNFLFCFGIVTGQFKTSPVAFHRFQYSKLKYIPKPAFSLSPKNRQALSLPVYKVIARQGLQHVKQVWSADIKTYPHFNHKLYPHFSRLLLVLFSSQTSSALTSNKARPSRGNSY